MVGAEAFQPPEIGSKGANSLGCEKKISGWQSEGTVVIADLSIEYYRLQEKARVIGNKGLVVAVVFSICCFSVVKQGKEPAIILAT
jgi:hypothetical protein